MGSIYLYLHNDMTPETDVKPKKKVSKKAADHFDLRLSEYLQSFTAELRNIVSKDSKFRVVFFALLGIEIFLFLLFFSFFAQSSILAFSIGGIVLTLFSYFAIRFYLQAHKPEQMMELRSRFLNQCKSIIPFSPGDAEFNLSLAHCMYEATSSIQMMEYGFFSRFKKLESLRPQFQKLSCLLHFKDVLKMREMLLFVAIRENIQLVKSMPTDLEAHASLANSYRLVAQIYLSPDKQSHGQTLPYIPKKYESEEMLTKFQAAAMRAVEEYKILDGFSPKDPWIHEQLASIYRMLEKPEDEIREYELICKLSPNDLKPVFRLGALYFEQGENAKGLHIYEKLKKAKDPSADILIGLYHAVSSEEYNPDDV